jgi:hypothetical protein
VTIFKFQYCIETCPLSEVYLRYTVLEVDFVGNRVNAIPNHDIALLSYNGHERQWTSLLHSIPVYHHPQYTATNCGEQTLDTGIKLYYETYPAGSKATKIIQPLFKAHLHTINNSKNRQNNLNKC